MDMCAYLCIVLHLFPSDASFRVGLLNQKGMYILNCNTFYQSIFCEVVVIYNLPPHPPVEDRTLFLRPSLNLESLFPN